LTTERLREYWRARPFVSFSLNTVDGRSFTIDHPEFLSFEKNSRTFTYFGPDGQAYVVDLLHIVDIQVSNND